MKMMTPSTKHEYQLRIAILTIVATAIVIYNGNGIKAHDKSLALALASQPSIAPIASRLVSAPPSPHIAHAGGLYRGRAYTNSIAALENSYSQGYRIMEVDFNRTTDQQTILLHDWENTVENVFDLAPGQRTLQQMKQRTATSPHQLATLNDFAVWAERHPDVQTILDIKTNYFDILREIYYTYPELQSRFIPYIYNFDDYEAVRRLGYTTISALIRPGQYDPETVLEFAQGHQLHSIAMLPEVLLEQNAELKNYVPIFCWTINDPRTADTLRRSGLYGVITDVLAPSPAKTSQTSGLNLGWIRS